jgi:hypothetical protein
LTVGYVVLIGALGFLISTSVFLACFLIMVRERRPLLVVAVSVLVPLVVFIFFVKTMGIPLPEGTLF